MSIRPRPSWTRTRKRVQRRFRDFSYQTLELLVAAPAPQGQGGIDPRRAQREIGRDLVAASGDAGPRCTKTSAARAGEPRQGMSGDLFSGRTSADIARQLRLWFASSPTFARCGTDATGLLTRNSLTSPVRQYPIEADEAGWAGVSERATNKFSFASACPYERMAAGRRPTGDEIVGPNASLLRQPGRQPQTLRRRHTSPEPNAQNAQYPNRLYHGTNPPFPGKGKTRFAVGERRAGRPAAI